MDPTLSKSQYIDGDRCPLMLWNHWHQARTEKTITGPQQARIDMGHEIGQLAREYFGPGAEITDDYRHTKDAVRHTREFVAQGETVIYEAAALNPADGTYCRADVLRKIPGTDEWDIIEVKSTTSAKDYHVVDLSFQYRVFTAAGYKIRDAYLMHLDNGYVRQGPVEPHKLLKLEKLTDRVKTLQAGIPARVQELVQIRAAGTPPPVVIGSQCSQPFDCNYKDHCWRDVPAASVFNVFAAPQAVKVARQTGSYDVKDVPEALYPKGVKVVDIEAAKSGRAHLDAAKVEAFLGKLEYPLYYLDYETIMPTIPLFDGTRPFQNVPFQFSLHIQRTPGGALEHHEFLHQERSDPREPFLRALIAACGTQGTVIAYNAEFETRRNVEMARDFPAHAAALTALNARVVDLIEPFKNRWLYHPDQHGSASIKKVLPAFTPDSYDDLDVANGPEAMGAYSRFITGRMEPDEDMEKFWAGLMQYCGQDTQAMVDLMKVLYDKTAAPQGPAGP